MPDDDEIDPQTIAFFFDFDGTLADIADDPASVVLLSETRNALAELSRLSGGALAVISGRPLQQLDRFLHPLKFPLSGVHGLERRDAAGRLHTTPFDSTDLSKMVNEITRFADSHEGLMAEAKPGSVALHYRRNPEMEADSVLLATRLASTVPGVTLMRGKMVVELRLGGRSKGDAVLDFMTEPPFEGRRPLYAGDDVTDEDAFHRVAAMNGITVKIGGGKTLARWRAADAAAFRRWLSRIVSGRGLKAGIPRGILEPADAAAPGRRLGGTTG